MLLVEPEQQLRTAAAVLSLREWLIVELGEQLVDGATRHNGLLYAQRYRQCKQVLSASQRTKWAGLFLGRASTVPGLAESTGGAWSHSTTAFVGLCSSAAMCTESSANSCHARTNTTPKNRAAGGAAPDDPSPSQQDSAGWTCDTSSVADSKYRQSWGGIRELAVGEPPTATRDAGATNNHSCNDRRAQARTPACPEPLRR